jgi:hypothetical protein
MSIAARKKRASAPAGQSASRIVAVAAMFGALFVGALCAGYGYVVRTKPVVPAERYRRGVVQYAVDDKGQCERFEFDNETGLIRPQDARECNVDMHAAARPDGAVGPLGGVRDYFRSR